MGRAAPAGRLNGFGPSGMFQLGVTSMRVPRTSSFVAAAALCAALAGCQAQPAPARPGGATSSRAERARRDAEAQAVAAVNAAAGAQAKLVPEIAVKKPGLWQKVVSIGSSQVSVNVPTIDVPPTLTFPPEPPAPKSAPRPGSPVLIRERVVSALPHPTAAEAEEDALAHAREVIEKRLAELDPPLRYLPSMGEVRSEFVRTDSRSERPLNPEERAALASYGDRTPRVYVEYDVEVTADQVRELRAQGRITGALRVLVALTTVALAGFVFLRADEWTKGYLTRWLALFAAGLAGGVAAMMLLL